MAEEIKRVYPKVMETLATMRAQMSTYLQGVVDGMGIEGHFKLDEKTGFLIPLPPPESKIEV